jgi:parvulin-like peptidyl-prolyl isomerase
MKMLRLLVLLPVLLVAFGCGGEKKGENKAQADEKPATETASGEMAVDRANQPDYISVQHILIAFQGSIPGKEVTRSKEEAGELARQIFERAQGGEDFDALVKEYTDDAYPGIYKMANTGVAPDMANKVFPRDGMVKAFGDVGFPLAVGEIGLAEYDATSSPYGWHIIKRVE